MIDLEHLEKYRENNRIEAKKALGGLPRSIWETYSAFANTLGGIILLGVEENPDKSLRSINLSRPEMLIKEFWDTINNQNKVSVNILSDKDVRIAESNGNHIIIITVPRAERFDKPVYIDGNPLSGTYRRNGEGDYRCTREEIAAMFRDAAAKTQDLRVLDTMDISVFNADSIRRYRNRMAVLRPGHVWEELDDSDFLYKIGGLGRSEDGKLHPTAAGLLMFGQEYEIVREFPHYFLDYREVTNTTTRWNDRIVSTSGDWSGNLYDFYFRVYQKLTENLPIPFKLKEGERIDDTPIHTAIREVLANCLVNTDYYGTRGIVITKGKDKITLSNPGGFRIDLDDALCGGVSDPRNTTLLKMFTLINIGERAGSGIPALCQTWNTEGWGNPEITEQFEPERTMVSLSLQTGDKLYKPAIYTGDKLHEPAINTGDKLHEPAINTGDKLHEPAINTGDKYQWQKDLIVQHITNNVSASTAEIADLLGLKVSRTREIIRTLIDEETLVPEGGRRNRRYKLKS